MLWPNQPAGKTAFAHFSIYVIFQTCKLVLVTYLMWYPRIRQYILAYVEHSDPRKSAPLQGKAGNLENSFEICSISKQLVPTYWYWPVLYATALPPSHSRVDSTTKQDSNPSGKWDRRCFIIGGQPVYFGLQPARRAEDIFQECAHYRCYMMSSDSFARILPAIWT